MGGCGWMWANLDFLAQSIRRKKDGAVVFACSPGALTGVHIAQQARGLRLTNAHLEYQRYFVGNRCAYRVHWQLQALPPAVLNHAARTKRNARFLQDSARHVLLPACRTLQLNGLDEMLVVPPLRGEPLEQIGEQPPDFFVFEELMKIVPETEVAGAVDLDATEA